MSINLISSIGNFIGRIFSFDKIPAQERKKVISTGLMFFFIASAYAIGRKTKDALISTRATVEIISLIKPAIIFPSIFIISALLMYSINFVKDKRKFTDRFVYLVSIPFICYFVFYIAIEAIGGEELFNKISPSFDIKKIIGEQSVDVSGMKLADVKKLPAVKSNFLKIYLSEFALIANKIYHVLFYTLTEIYGSLVLSYSFWTYVNTYTTKEKAAVVYPQYVAFSGFSTIFSGLSGIAVTVLLSKFCSSPMLTDKLSNILNMSLCVICMILPLFLYKISLQEHKNEVENIELPTKKKKVQVGFLQSLKILSTNKIILSLAIGTISYMICINLVESVWKKYVLTLAKGTSNPRAFMDSVYNGAQLLTGLLTMCITGLCTYSLSNWGWTFTALVSPITLGISGVLFFIITQLALHSSLKITIGFVITMLHVAVFVGLLQNVATKTLKYSFFDSTKEIGYLHLTKEQRDQGKSAIEMIGSRGGKSASSIMQQLLMGLLVPVSQMSHGIEIISKYLGVILAIFVVLWIFSVIVIGKEISKIKEESKKNKS